MSKKIFITGANGGFGKLATISLLEAGHQVVGTMRTTTGRNQEIADELKGKGAQLVELDVTSNESVENGVAKAKELMGGLDVIINNAGVGVVGMQEHFTPEDFKRLFDINVFGVQRVNRAALPTLRGQNSGLIIYVSSLLGRITLPYYGPYNASKWALEAMAENYRAELSNFGVESAIVEPGGYPTTFMTSLMTPSDESRIEAYGEAMHGLRIMGENFERTLSNSPQQNPQDVADAIVNLVNQSAGERPFRTVVDKIGMGDPVKPYNETLEQMTQGMYGAFGMADMLKVNTGAYTDSE